MPYMCVGKSKLYCEVYGEGPAIVLAHGVGGNHASWHHQIPHFSKNYRVVVIDQRGFGLSEDVEGLGRATMADDLVRTLDYLKIGRAALIGQSMGGGTCVGVACGFRDRVSALVLADTVHGIAIPDSLRRLSIESEAAAARMTQAERVLGPRIRQEDPDRAFLYMQIAGFNHYSARTVRGDFEQFTPESLAHTGLPVLFLVGEHDARFPVALVRGVHQSVKNSQLIEVTGAGHSAYFERPDLFNSSVQRFLDTSWPGK